MSSNAEDPVVTASRREAVAVLSGVAIALGYTIITCYRMGYGPGSHELKFVHLFGGVAFPEWVFWGIVVPWITCFVIGSVFSFFVMKDADLGEELEEDDEVLATDASAKANMTNEGAPNA